MCSLRISADLPARAAKTTTIRCRSETAKRQNGETDALKRDHGDAAVNESGYTLASGVAVLGWVNCTSRDERGTINDSKSIFDLAGDRDNGFRHGGSLAVWPARAEN